MRSPGGKRAEQGNKDERLQYKVVPVLLYGCET